jgi:16S rRNA G966 N2-methylase RsmD
MVVSMDLFEVLTLPLGAEESPRLEFDKEKLVKTIDDILAQETLNLIKSDVKGLLDNIIENPFENSWSCYGLNYNGRAWKVDKDVFVNNLQQICETKTIERTRYYLARLKTSISRVKTGKINDINLNRWKEYNEIRTDSLWVDKKRDRSGCHIGSYWGNFIPQIPRQMMMRYTKAYDYVLDTFAGSGTSLIECRRLGRNGIGLELNPTVAKQAQSIIEQEDNPFEVKTEVVNANSVTANYKEILKEKGIEKVQMVVMHPPYFDIIRFSEDEDDLSNAASVEDFLERLEEIAKNSYQVLEKGRYACLVIGDKYHKSEWIPLGFYAMERMQKVGFSLKSIIVKNFDQTKGKRQQEELWRYRALVGGYYIFKHEYIFLFQRV